STNPLVTSLKGGAWLPYDRFIKAIIMFGKSSQNWVFSEYELNQSSGSRSVIRRYFVIQSARDLKTVPSFISSLIDVNIIIFRRYRSLLTLFDVIRNRDNSIS